MDRVLQVREAQNGHGPPGPPSSSTTSTSSSDTTKSATSSTSPTDTVASVTPAISSTHTATPSGSSLPSSTSANASPTSSNAASGATTLPELSQSNAPSGISTGVIAAAVVIPIVVILLLAIFGLLWRRRRRANGNASVLPVMKERSRPRTTGAPPILMSNTNTAYYTGIGTSPEEPNTEYYNGLGESFEPPPAYKAKNLDGTRNVTIPIAAGAGSTVPAVREPTGYRRDSPSPDSWATPPRDNSLLEPSEYARSISSQAVTDTEQSITSTQYSDSASIHSAQAARMSVGGAHVLAPQRSLDPFGDPDSSVSSLAGDRSTNPSRGISPVSIASRNRQ